MPANRCGPTSIVCVLAGAALVSPSAIYSDDLQLSTTFEITSGTYGGDVATEEIYIPFTVAYTYEPVGVRLTVPYIRISSPDGSLFSTGQGGLSQRPSNGGIVDEGLGDVLAGITYYDLLKARSQWLVDVTGRVKFGTADEEQFLGTGEDDYTLQLDLARALDRTTPFFGIGHKWLGDAPGIDYQNQWFAIAGSDFRVDGYRYASVSLYQGTPSLSGNDGPLEATTSVSTRITGDWRMGAYLILGFSDASPDWGLGLTVSSRFDPLHRYRESLR